MRAVANFWDAAQYINAMFRRADNEPTNMDRQLYSNTGLVSPNGLYENMPGRVSFRIYRNRFTVRDTMGCVLKRVIPVLGGSYVISCTYDTETYAWRISATRFITVWHRDKVGTFIQLSDTAPATGVWE